MMTSAPTAIPDSASAPEWAGLRIFMTGGTGFFGRSLLSALARGWFPGARFTLLARRAEELAAERPDWARLPGVEFLNGDVRDFAFPDQPCDAIIHAATPALTTVPDAEMTSIIVDGTRHVLELARRHGVRKVLMISSGAVYGPQPPGLDRIPESHPPRPVTAYGRGKLAAERLLLDSGVPVTVARGFAFTGPHLNRDIHFAIGNFIRDALAGRPVLIRGDGTPVRSYLYADDLIEQLGVMLLRGAPGAVYNLGSPEAVSIRELAELCNAVLGNRAGLRIAGTPHPESPVQRYVPDVELARRELGLVPRVPLPRAIELSARAD